MPSASQSPARKLTRRALLLSASAAAGYGLLRRVFPPELTSVHASGIAEAVTIVEFAPDGKRIGTATVALIRKTDPQWQQQLSPISFQVTRQAATERAYSGKGWNLHQPGIYRCICCETALFHSSAKFDSGTGWPSFWQPIARENLRESRDSSLGMERVAVSCRRCEGHLGHLFDDGPPPTGLRYCMNAAALHFVSLAQ
jgi:peptide-methionine (R)-S-oxide reductase